MNEGSSLIGDPAARVPEGGDKHTAVFINSPLSACPTGWLYDPGETPEVAKLAVETGLWPLKEAIYGEVTHTYVPKRKPVEDYLKLQGRFRHLFEPTLQRDTVRYIQERVDAYWSQINA